MQNNSKITPCLWFDDQAEAAAQFYTSIFRNSKIVHVSRYGDAGQEIHGKPAGAVMTVSFELDVHVRTIRSSKRRIDYKRRNQCNSILT